MENSFHITMRVHDGFGWLSRPLVLVIIAIIGMTIFLAWKNLAKSQKQQSPGNESTESVVGNSVFSAPLALVLLVLCVAAAIVAMPWPGSVKRFPIIAVVPGALLLTWVLVQDLRRLRGDIEASGGVRKMLGLVME